jgi:2-keto-4-pentenoate hydratase/2-oxohepta-3-ene-1,7-dioic acid hydratase in catechol pathway
VLCLGLNYAAHAQESNMARGRETAAGAPAHPTLFTKAPTSVNSPFGDIVVDPAVTEQVDWEVELGVIIGRAGKNIRREQALDYVFGYTVINDVSARDIQVRHGGQFFKGKSIDGYCPMGPCIVTPEELGDPQNLRVLTRVNGETKQDASTADMIWDVAACIEALSLGMTLEPGDIIATGTPSGVGFARKPPEFLRPGDVMETVIEKIGTLRNNVVGA